MNVVCYLIISFVFLFVKPISSTALPIWAKIRKQCPDAENRTAWIMAATKLDCLHSGDSRLPSEQKRVYHCLPSNLLNEYVEFCGINSPIEPGYCPVFKYVNTNGRNRGPSYMNCSSFQFGCPDEQYFSKNVHRYPECLAINKIDMCYTADASCPRVEEVTVSRETPLGVPRSSFSSTTDIVVKINDNDVADTIDERIAVPLFLSLVIAVAVLIYVLYLVEKRWKRKRVFKGTGIDAETFFRERFKGDEDEETAFLVRHELKGLQLKKLLYEIANELRECDVEQLKYFLRTNDKENFEDTNTEIDRKNKLELLEYMDLVFHLDLNIYILEGYMENIKKKKLAEKCIKFAQNSKNPLIYYVRQRYILGCTEILVKLDRDINDFTREEAETIVKEIQQLLNARRNQIILYGISEGCIQLHLAIKNTLMPRLRRSNLHNLHKYKVFKVSIREECIYYCSNVDLKHQTECHSRGNYALSPPKVSNFYVSLRDGEPIRNEKESCLEEFKMFDELASTSTRKDISEVTTVKFLHAATTGSAPLNFNLDDQCDCSKFLEKCQVLRKGLKSNPDLPTKLGECSFVSHKDVERILEVLRWFYRQSQGETNLFGLMKEELDSEEEEEEDIKKEELTVPKQQVQMVSFHLSPLSVPEGIMGTFRQCAMYQKDKDLKRRFVSVVVLDEVGLARESPRMPFKEIACDQSMEEDPLRLCKTLKNMAAFNPYRKDQNLFKLCSVGDVFDPDPTYKLTTDNVEKILANYLRFRCNIPVIIKGETGCGKTRLVKFLCQFHCPIVVEVQNMILKKVHGGTRRREIIRKVLDAKRIAQENTANYGQRLYTVLFDEANTTEAIGLIKEIMCDRYSENLIMRLEKAGLGYHVDTDKTTYRMGRVPLRKFEFKIPKSFRQLENYVERINIKQMNSRLVGVTGFSNWTQDPAKMIREIPVLREISDHEEHLDGAKCTEDRRIKVNNKPSINSLPNPHIHIVKAIEIPGMEFSVLNDLYSFHEKLDEEKKYLKEENFRINDGFLRDNLLQISSDLIRVDCGIVIHGETSTWKSASLIYDLLNKIELETNVLRTFDPVQAQTFRVCNWKTLSSEYRNLIVLGILYQMSTGTSLQQRKSELREIAAKPIEINTTLGDSSSDGTETKASDIDGSFKNTEKTRDVTFTVGVRGIDEGKMDKEHDLQTQNHLRDPTNKYHDYSQLYAFEEKIPSKEEIKLTPPTRINTYSEFKLLKMQIEMINIELKNVEKKWELRMIEIKKAQKVAETRMIEIEKAQKVMEARIIEIKKAQKVKESRMIEIKKAQMVTEARMIEIKNAVNICIRDSQVDSYKIKRELLQTEVSGLRMPYNTVKDISYPVCVSENATYTGVACATVGFLSAMRCRPKVRFLLSAGCSFVFGLKYCTELWRLQGPNDGNAQRAFTERISGSDIINKQNIFDRSFQLLYRNMTFFFSDFIQNKIFT